ncbi:MAG: hypothetical protein AB7V55_01695 [Oscillospiraceae bacterium]
MRILVCYKTAYDTEYITPDELEALRDGALDLTYFKKIIAQYDEAALEAALRLKEQALAGGEAVFLCALTVGVHEAPFAQDLYALGFDEVALVKTQQQPGCAPEEVARQAAAFFARGGGFDVVLTGRQAPPGESGQVPFLLAEMLGVPCLPNVYDVHYAPGGLRAELLDGGGAMRLGVQGPAVCAMGDAKHPYLRVATLREKLAARGKEAVAIEETPSENRMPVFERERYVYEKPQKHGRMLPGETAREKAEALWQTSIAEWVVE